MKKSAGKVHAIFECLDCEKIFDNKNNAQGLAAQHAKKYKHKVIGEVGIACTYDGRDEN